MSIKRVYVTLHKQVSDFKHRQFKSLVVHIEKTNGTKEIWIQEPRKCHGQFATATTWASLKKSISKQVLYHGKKLKSDTRLTYITSIVLLNSITYDAKLNWLCTHVLPMITDSKFRLPDEGVYGYFINYS